MKTKSIVSLLLSCLLLLGCKKTAPGDESLGPGELAKWNDSNIDIISVGAYNYTDYDIYSVFLLPPDKNDLGFAAHASGGRAVPRDEDRWELGGGAGADLAWDYRWKTPRKFKVWWFRIVDKEAYAASGNRYDKYSMKQTEPGAAWCEGEIVVTRSPTKGKSSYLILHFYPDGRIEGNIEGYSELNPAVEISRRGELQVLRDRACLNEVSNPYFGKKKPVQMN